jgi:phosphatidate cytidylyltransferase
MAALVAVVVLLGQRELERLLEVDREWGWKLLGWISALLIPAGAFWSGERGLLMASVACLLLWMTLEMCLRPDPEGVSRDLGIRLLGYLYAAVLPSYFLLVRGLPEGVHWILWTMTVTAVGDTAAFYVGSFWGRRRLIPRISPNKTVEGALAGLAGNLVGGGVYAAILFPPLFGGSGIGLALVVGVMGQLGDLCESMLKRSGRVKDSGGMLPGHGGILDRLDSLLFSIPVVYYWAAL